MCPFLKKVARYFLGESFGKINLSEANFCHIWNQYINMSEVYCDMSCSVTPACAKIKTRK